MLRTAFQTRALAGLLLVAGVAPQSRSLSAADAEEPLVIVAELEDQTISPGITRYLDRAFGEAESRNAECLVIILDTPGGLLDSTRSLVKQILASDVPVVVYVAPSGSRAASAGMFVTLSAHVAAMAPGTTIGAAHPVQVGSLPAGPQPGDEGGDEVTDDAAPQQRSRSPMEEKIVNDTAAWAEALAALRERNAELAQRAVRESVSVRASQAREQGLIDVVADDLGQLLAEIDGRTVSIPQGTSTLRTAGAATETVSIWWGESLLTIIAHPNIAFLLMMFGFYGILFELYSPGWGVPGVLGVISMLLGLFGMAVLPVNYLGFALWMVALGLFVAEIFVTSYGALAIAGTVCLVLGGTMLIDSPAGFSQVSLAVILPVAAATALVVLVLAVGVFRAHRTRTQTGGEGLIGQSALTVDDFVAEDSRFTGSVRLHGELWKATSDEPMQAGQACRVRKRDGLTLRVGPEENGKTASTTS